jgi:hypothetical protein
MLMPSVFYAECHNKPHYAECHYTEGHYAESRYAEYCGANEVTLWISTKIESFTSNPIRG